MIADDILHHDQDYKVLICKKHEYVLQNLNSHLCNEHQIISVKKCHVIIKKYRQYELVKSAEMWLLFLLNSLMSVLRWSVKTLQCEERACEFVSINYKMMQKHCNREHDWKHSADNSEHWRNVHVQIFFVSHNLFYYFVVHVSESDDNDSQLKVRVRARISNISEVSQKDLINAVVIKHEWADVRKKHQQKLKLINERITKTD